MKPFMDADFLLQTDTAKTLWGKSKAFRKISETWDICD